MIDKRSWRYEGHDALGKGIIPDFNDSGKEIGEWVPDTRLQAIADAWVELRQTDAADFDAHTTAINKVDALLDALTKKNMCLCMCHEESGSHEDRCRCNGGEGWCVPIEENNNE